MPHLKCVACRIRLHSPPSPVGELCPGCGSPLEPVRELSELVGLQAIRWEPDEAQQESDAWRWLDDGGSFSPEAVAQAMAKPEPDP